MEKLAKGACSHCTLYGHDVRALDVLLGYWPCLYGQQPIADRYNPHLANLFVKSIPGADSHFRATF